MEIELWWEVWGCQVRPRGLGYILGLYPKNIRSEAFEGHGEGDVIGFVFQVHKLSDSKTEKKKKS